MTFFFLYRRVLNISHTVDRHVYDVYVCMYAKHHFTLQTCVHVKMMYMTYDVYIFMHAKRYMHACKVPFMCMHAKYHFTLHACVHVKLMYMTIKHYLHACQVLLRILYVHAKYYLHVRIKYRMAKMHRMP